MQAIVPIGRAGRSRARLPPRKRAGWRQVVLTWRAPRPPSIRGVSAAPAACMRWHLDHANHQLAPAARHTSGHLASPPMRASPPPPDLRPSVLGPRHSRQKSSPPAGNKNCLDGPVHEALLAHGAGHPGRVCLLRKARAAVLREVQPRCSLQPVQYGIWEVAFA